MLQSKSFVKKTKQGRIQKVTARANAVVSRGAPPNPTPLPDAVVASSQVVREHYLRDDIYCSFIPCTACAAAAERKLSAAAAAILVIDTNVVLHQVTEVFLHLPLSLGVRVRWDDELRCCVRSICWRTRRLRMSSCCQ
jgi:hypothetical protein